MKDAGLDQTLMDDREREKVFNKQSKRWVTEKEKSYSINRARDGSLIRKTMAGFLPHTVYKNQLYVDLKI